MINYLHTYALPFTIIATKADKLGKTRIKGRVDDIGRYLTVGGNSILAVSSETGYGKDKILDKIERVLEIYNDEFFNLVDDDSEEEIEEEN